MPFNDAPIVRDIGVVASTDPIAIDQASVDLVNQERGLPQSCLKRNKLSGKDKFKGLYPEVEWAHQLKYGEKIDLIMMLNDFQTSKSDRHQQLMHH